MQSEVQPLIIRLLAVLTLAGASSDAQTVQQPVFRFFTTDTTVMVPDGGQAYLGGVDYARMGSVSRGTPMLGKLPGAGRLFNNRAIGNEFTSGRSYVRAQIIDLNEMDEDVLAAARRQRGGAVWTGPPQGDLAPRDQRHGRQAEANFLAQHVGRNVRPEPDHIRRANEIAPKSEARRLLSLGDQALAEGQLELATRYYQAAEKLSGGH